MDAGGLMHVDEIQAFGKIPFDIKGMNADLVTLSEEQRLADTQGCRRFDPG